MGGVTSVFQRKDPRTPVKGALPRVKNVAKYHFRGILGVIIPFILLVWQPQKGKHDITVRCLWIWMFWFFLLQPVNIPVTGFIPLFLLPMGGVMSTVETCKCYFNENIGLLILGGMVHLLLNGCGFERRMILWFLCSGDSCQFSGKRIILKASTAAFFTSIISNRLIVTSTITQFLTPSYIHLQTSTAKYRKTEADYDKMRHIVLNSVQTASSIGSTTMVHSALTIITMRAMWSTHPPDGFEYPDIFNYLQYTCFAFPVAFFMFIFNFLYHMLLINCVIQKPMSGNSMNEMRKLLLTHQEALPPVTTYMKKCVLLYCLFLILLFFRWPNWFDGWSANTIIVPQIPMIKDTTVAAIFVVILHMMPRSITFWKYMTSRNRTELGVLKSESSVMWWRYVDKNTLYGYMILIGGGVALNTAVRVSTLDVAVTNFAKNITELPWFLSILIVCIISVLFANLMSGVAACCVILPFILNMVKLSGRTESIWSKNLYLGAVAVGIGTSMGFTSPFLYTPAYFCHYTGKVPVKKMVIYSIGSAVICCIILWIALCFWGQLIWDPQNEGIKILSLVVTTTEAGGDQGGEEPPEPPP